jgi:hypothetical protein
MRSVCLKGSGDFFQRSLSYCQASNAMIEYRKIEQQYILLTSGRAYGIQTYLCSFWTFRWGSS